MTDYFEEIPPLIPCRIGFELLGVTQETGYRLTRKGAIRVAALPGSKRIPLIELERVIGRKITLQELQAAVRRWETDCKARGRPYRLPLWHLDGAPPLQAVGNSELVAAEGDR